MALPNYNCRKGNKIFRKSVKISNVSDINVANPPNFILVLFAVN